MFIFSISCFALAIYSLKETFPLTSAKKIKEEMKTFYRNSADQVSLYYNSTSQTMSKRILSEEEKEIARKRFESHFGEIESSDLTSIDNETIDADLAQEYSSNHQED